MPKLPTKQIHLLGGPGDAKQLTVPAYFTTFAYPVGSDCNYREYVYNQSSENPDCFQYEDHAQ
jgi:hypothetical protein